MKDFESTLLTDAVVFFTVKYFESREEIPSKKKNSVWIKFRVYCRMFIYCKWFKGHIFKVWSHLNYRFTLRLKNSS